MTRMSLDRRVTEHWSAPHTVETTYSDIAWRQSLGACVHWTVNGIANVSDFCLYVHDETSAMKSVNEVSQRLEPGQLTCAHSSRDQSIHWRQRSADTSHICRTISDEDWLFNVLSDNLFR